MLMYSSGVRLKKLEVKRLNRRPASTSEERKTFELNRKDRAMKMSPLSNEVSVEEDEETGCILRPYCMTETHSVGDDRWTDRLESHGRRASFGRKSMYTCHSVSV